MIFRQLLYNLYDILFCLETQVLICSDYPGGRGHYLEYLDSSGQFHYFLSVGRSDPAQSQCSSVVEQLIRNQQVEGSTPSAGSPCFEILI